jgi:hypothetical protein
MMVHDRRGCSSVAAAKIDRPAAISRWLQQISVAFRRFQSFGQMPYDLPAGGA